MILYGNQAKCHFNLSEAIAWNDSQSFLASVKAIQGVPKKVSAFE